MYYLIWRYQVDASNQSKFEEEYGRGGSWFKLFEPCSEYMGHELIRNTKGGEYVLIDKWLSKQDYDGFVKSHQLEYDGLNSQFSGLYSSEELIGTFETL